MGRNGNKNGFNARSVAISSLFLELPRSKSHSHAHPEARRGPAINGCSDGHFDANWLAESECIEWTVAAAPWVASACAR